MGPRPDVRSESAWRRVARRARGFMPVEEGDALYDAAVRAARACPGFPLVEIGSYCGRSTVWLGAAARAAGTVLFAVDHHRGSEENQPGWEWHEPDLVDPSAGVLDTLPEFRRTIRAAGLEPWVIAVVGDSPTVARFWTTPAALVFIDGGHGVGPAHADFAGWAPRVARGGSLAIHDVFTDPAEGGTAPHDEIYVPALASGEFEEIARAGALRVLRRSAPGG